MSPVRNAGFAMLDVLVALLLLAVALSGACGALVQGMRATQGALLNSHAVDLAADLTEELHDVNSVAQFDATVTAWRGRVAASLPVTGLEPEHFAVLHVASPDGEDAPRAGVAEYQLTLRWQAGSSGALRELHLPLVAPAMAIAP